MLSSGRPVMVYDSGRRQRTGSAGEQIAVKFLEGAGHTVLDRNWRTGHLELDIVSVKEGGIHFVEVKSRVFPMEAEPEANVGPAKQKRLVAAARKWLKMKGCSGMECSFDVVCVVFKDETYSVRYFPEAFIPIFV